MKATMTPLISVVLTTYNRRSLLQKSLLSLACQSLAKDDYEVIVVDDGSEPDCGDLVQAMQRYLPVKYARQSNVGLASAKNHGLYYCRGPIVLFLDDDDLCDSELLAFHLLAHQQYPDLQTAVLGHTKLTIDANLDPLMHYVTAVGGHLFSYVNFQDNEFLDYMHFWGGRTSVKRSYLLSHGVFNPIFRFGFEDIELGYRLSRSGLRVVYEKQAVSTMARTISLEDFHNRCRRQGESAYRFLELYPSDPSLVEKLCLRDSLAEWDGICGSYHALRLSAARLDAMMRSITDRTTCYAKNCETFYHLALARSFRASLLCGYQSAAVHASRV
jgi:glycosyltransferase involved in cell wall biosynthesis